ncbi:MAG: polysaccharide deacetylase family protein [Candidatus Neomarinimicrobiota bacterium]
MKNGWYILNYHNISWEENIYLRGIGGSFPPDIFESHIEYLSKHGNIVSIKDGFKKYISSDIKEPLISIWFDDGFRAVRKYALPIIEDNNATAAISICSRFLLKKELFWRLKLSYISQIDSLRFLRGKLRKFGYKTSTNVNSFVLDNFSDEVLKAIDEVYNDFSNQYLRDDAFRIFDDVAGIKILQDHGWTIANHSAAHYPISEDSYFDHFTEEYEECEKVIKHYFNMDSKFWVLPFDRTSKRAKKLISHFNKINLKKRDIVLLEDKVNKYPELIENVLFRIVPPNVDGRQLINHLNKINYYEGGKLE